MAVDLSAFTPSYNGQSPNLNGWQKAGSVQANANVYFWVCSDRGMRKPTGRFAITELPRAVDESAKTAALIAIAQLGLRSGG